MAATVILLSLLGVFIQAENWYDQIGLSAIKSVNPVYWADDYALFTIYQTSFAPARKPYWIGLLFTHKNSDFSAIFVTKRSCTAPTLKEDLHISDTFMPLNWHSGTVAEKLRKSEDWTH